MSVRAYRFRFYPTLEQEHLLRRTMGCVRLVYNKALAIRTESWYQRQQRISYAETSSLVTQWKKLDELNFLNEVSCVPLQQCLRHLQSAFANFWAGRAKYPNFKKRRNGGCAEYARLPRVPPGVDPDPPCAPARCRQRDVHPGTWPGPL